MDVSVTNGRETHQGDRRKINTIAEVNDVIKSDESEREREDLGHEIDEKSFVLFARLIFF